LDDRRRQKVGVPRPNRGDKWKEPSADSDVGRDYRKEEGDDMCCEFNKKKPVVWGANGFGGREERGVSHDFK